MITILWANSAHRAYLERIEVIAVPWLLGHLVWAVLSIFLIAAGVAFLFEGSLNSAGSWRKLFGSLVAGLVLVGLGILAAAAPNMPFDAGWYWCSASVGLIVGLIVAIVLDV